MVVNVSCTSACTDDEDDSDLLSSSTLTLTEEELGIKDDDSSVTSEDEYIEGSLTLGLDYIKGEFQSWMKPRSQTKEKNEADLVDELQCGTMSKDILSPVKTANDRHFLSRSVLNLLEANTNAKNESLGQGEVDGNRRDATRSLYQPLCGWHGERECREHSHQRQGWRWRAAEGRGKSANQERGII